MIMYWRCQRITDNYAIPQYSGSPAVCPSACTIPVANPRTRSQQKAYKWLSYGRESATHSLRYLSPHVFTCENKITIMMMMMIYWVSVSSVAHNMQVLVLVAQVFVIPHASDSQIYCQCDKSMCVAVIASSIRITPSRKLRSVIDSIIQQQFSRTFSSPEKKMGVALVQGISLKFCGSPLTFLQQLRLATSNLVCSLGLPRAITNHTQRKK